MKDGEKDANSLVQATILAFAELPALTRALEKRGVISHHNSMDLEDVFVK